MNTSDMAKALGRRGGLARGRRLAPAERRQIASMGGRARIHSLRAARRILENFRYAAAMDDLRGGAPVVRRVESFSGPLPGIYPADRGRG